MWSVKTVSTTQLCLWGEDMILADPQTHEEWLLCRNQGIGGSDAACVLGMNKYKSNVQLWKEKTGPCIPDDISDKPAVKYGKLAEAPIRELFILDFPQYKVEYHEYRMYANDDHPYIFATLDGELTDENGRKGILEIKTTTINNSSQWNEWDDDNIPQNYYIQLLHQMIATGYDFAVLKAHIRHFKDGRLYETVWHYTVNREEEKESMEILLKAEIDFWNDVVSKRQPSLILPEI